MHNIQPAYTKNEQRIVLREGIKQRVIQPRSRMYADLDPIALLSSIPKVILLEVGRRFREPVFVRDVVDSIDDVKCVGYSSIDVDLNGGLLGGVLDVDKVEAVGRFFGRRGASVAQKSDGIVSAIKCVIECVLRDRPESHENSRCIGGVGSPITVPTIRRRREVLGVCLHFEAFGQELFIDRHHTELSKRMDVLSYMFSPGRS